MDDGLMIVYDWRKAKQLRQSLKSGWLDELVRGLASNRPVLTLSPAYRLVPAKGVLLAVLVAGLHVRRRHAQ